MFFVRSYCDVSSSSLSLSLSCYCCRSHPNLVVDGFPSIGTVRLTDQNGFDGDDDVDEDYADAVGTDAISDRFVYFRSANFQFGYFDCWWIFSL